MKVNNMKKSLWIVLAVVAVLAVWGYSVYNGLVEKEEAYTVRGRMSRRSISAAPI